MKTNPNYDFFNAALKNAKKATQIGIISAIKQQEIRENKGGELVIARGIASVLNKGLRNRIKIDV